jgi:PST family polysaccharide transporter
MSGISKNISYLIVAQAFIYLAPLITLPYLTRTLGDESYGTYGFIQAIVQYFVLITDYGFSITATRLIAINSTQKIHVSSVVANTIAVKLLLVLLCALLSLLLLAVFPTIGQHTDILVACFIGVLGNALFPTWLFQGLEKMRVLALIICLSRLIPLPFFFIWVHNSGDVVMAAALQNIPGIIAAIFSFYYAIRHQLIEPVNISIDSIISMLKEGWAVFLSNMSTSFYTTVNGILIGAFAGKDQAAYFYATDKLRVAAQGFIQPIAATLFPRITALSQTPERAQECKKLVIKGTGLLVIIELACGLVMYFGADIIAAHYLGKDFLPAAIYLKSLAFLPLVIALATVFSQWRFQALGHSVSLSKIYLIAGPLHSLYATYLTYHYHTYGLISSLYITEIGITLAMVLVLKNKKIPLF